MLWILAIVTSCRSSGRAAAAALALVASPVGVTHPTFTRAAG